LLERAGGPAQCQISIPEPAVGDRAVTRHPAGSTQIEWGDRTRRYRDCKPSSVLVAVMVRPPARASGCHNQEVRFRTSLALLLALSVCSACGSTTTSSTGVTQTTLPGCATPVAASPTLSTVRTSMLSVPGNPFGVATTCDLLESNFGPRLGPPDSGPRPATGRIPHT
jgi:hypothetical protein